MAIDLGNLTRTIHAGVILTQGTTEMLDVAPFEFFAWLDKAGMIMLNLPPEMSKEALDVKLHWVTEDGKTASMKSGAQILPTDSFETCPPLDIALMGAHDPQYHLSKGEVAFIRKTYEQCGAFLTICGGVLALLEADLLSGKTASVPRMAFDMMRKIAPHVHWLDRRWARDGKIWSSSSLLNGTDLIRAFAEETWGGRSGMIEAVLDAGHYPVRDVDFKDFHGTNFAIESLG